MNSPMKVQVKSSATQAAAARGKSPRLCAADIVVDSLDVLGLDFFDIILLSQKNKKTKFGFPESLLILAVVLLLFGVERISKIAGEFGKGIHSFRKGLK